MKKIFYSILFSFILASVVIAAEVSWQTLSENGKSIDIMPSQTKIVTNKIDNELITYFVRTKNNNGFLMSGIIAICKPDGEHEVALIASIPINANNTGNLANKQENKNAEFKKATGAIKISTDYVCKNYYNEIYNYKNLVTKAKEYADAEDYKSAIYTYNLGLTEAIKLKEKGYSIKRQTNILFAMADLYEKDKKYKQAKECYQKILDMDNIQDLTVKADANKKMNELPEIKGEKAKKVFGDVVKGVGTVGAGAALILLNGASQ